MALARGGGGASTSKLRLLVTALAGTETPKQWVLLGNLSSRGVAAYAPCLSAPGASQGSPSLHWGPGCWEVIGQRAGPQRHNSPLVALSAWPPRSSLGSLPGPVGGPPPAESSPLSVVAAAFSSLALLSPPRNATGQTCHFPSDVHLLREAGGGVGAKGPCQSLSQTLLPLTLTSTPECRQGQRRKLRPREATRTEGQRQRPHQKPPAQECLPIILPSTAKASVFSPGLVAGSASDFRAWQAVMMSCICRKLATASTSSTFSELRLSLAVYINSSTCPRPAKDTDSHHRPTSRPGASSLPAAPLGGGVHGLVKSTVAGHHLPISCAGTEASNLWTQPRQQFLNRDIPTEDRGCEVHPAWKTEGVNTTPTLHQRTRGMNTHPTQGTKGVNAHPTQGTKGVNAHPTRRTKGVKALPA